MARQFRKKPIIIDAFRYRFDDLPEWARGEEITYYIGFAIIKTLEGEMRAEEGDYIIKGIKGELYPCKPDIFEASYEELPSCDHSWVDIQTNQPIASLGVNWVHGDGLAICVHCGIKK